MMQLFRCLECDRRTLFSEPPKSSEGVMIAEPGRGWVRANFYICEKCESKNTKSKIDKQD